MSPASTRPWAGIVRVSHMGKRKAGADNVHADRDQVDALRAHARRLDVRLEMLSPELDVSGGLPLDRRPSLRKAVDGVEAGLYGGIMVAYLSRLGRNVREQLAVWDRVETAGGRIVAAQENIDTSTPNGRFIRTLMLANAERELEEHAERFENLRRWATMAGVWQRRQTPRGYARDPETRRLVPDEQAESVRGAFRGRASGTPISHLARDLAMTPAGTRALLRNRVYLGELHVGQHSNPEAHPALVTEDEWLAVQARHEPARPPRSDRPIALLAGLVRCVSCGHVMSRSTGGKGQVVYACHRQHSAGQCPRPTAITAETIDAHVEAVALSELAKLHARIEDADRDVKEARAALRDAQAEIAAYLEGVSAAGLPPGEYARGATARQSAVDQARDDLGTLLANRPASPDGDPKLIWQQMNAEQRNRQLRGLIEAVLVVPVGRGRSVPPGQRTRVIARGAGVVTPYGGGGSAAPITTVPLPDVDHPAVLGV